MPESEDLSLQRDSSSKALANRRKQRENERKHGTGNYSCRRSNSTGSTKSESLVGTTMRSVVNQERFFRRLGLRLKKLRRERGYSQEDMISFGFSVRHWQQ